MAQNITLMGASYSDVPAVQLPKTGGGTALFSDPSITTAIASDVASGKTFLLADGSIGTGTASGGGGGGGVGTLLLTESLGTINTTSTSTAAVKTLSVTGINSYDLLIVESSVDTVVMGRHLASVGVIILQAYTSISAKTSSSSSIATVKWNAKISDSGTVTSNISTTAAGVYPYSVSVSDGTISIQINRRYNQTSTTTINGAYTARVYGVSLYDLIGG